MQAASPAAPDPAKVGAGSKRSFGAIGSIGAIAAPEAPPADADARRAAKRGRAAPDGSEIPPGTVRPLLML